jgi:hypothetical protein
MKKMLLGCITLLISCFIIPNLAVAASGATVAGFEITAPTTAVVNEAIDITVRAVDKDKKTVTNYRGSIIFDSDNFWDTIPSPGKAIAFTAENNGEIKFSKGITFKSAGKQKVYVYDVADDNLTGEAVVQVDGKSGTSSGTTETVTIITPENNTQISGDSIIISGKARKNSKVSLILNGKDIGTVSSDESGIFTKNISGITQDKNILLANLIDADGKTIGTSSSINFSKSTKTTGFYNMTITPGTTVEAGSEITLTVESDPAMKNVMILIDNTLLETKEWDAGKYTIKTIAPAGSGIYNLDVTITDPTGQITKKEKAATLTVTAKAPPAQSNFKNVRVESQDQKVLFTFSVENAPVELDKFKILYGENEQTMTGEAITYSTGKIQKPDGTYSWYISNLAPKTYFFKILGLKADGTWIDKMASESVSAMVGKTTCTIGNVGNLLVEKNDGKSIISWMSVTGAISYNVYKVSSTGEYALFQNTKEPRLEVLIASGAVKNEDFVVKGLCDEKTLSTDYSKASQVQTGPWMIAILIIISGIMSIMMLRRRIR